MSAKTMEQIQAELKGKAILVANRGIPARRICRAIRERFGAVAVMTATDVDKTSPAAYSAQELMLLGATPTAYLDLDLIISKAKALVCHYLIALVVAEFILPWQVHAITILHRCQVLTQEVYHLLIKEI